MKIQNNSILFSVIDREDYWVTSGLCFKIDNHLSYKEAYESLKEKLESNEIVEYVIEDKRNYNQNRLR